MEELYIQKFGNKRIIQVKGWTPKDALLYDIKNELTYAMTWDVFHRHHEKLDVEIDVSEYEGADLDRVKKDLTNE